jgi:hypothetical protein
VPRQVSLWFTVTQYDDTSEKWVWEVGCITTIAVIGDGAVSIHSYCS